ncbi:MAG: hypothetical protein LBU47_02180 [Christensenellaceae bacterium]|jgi:hypothetical protein|nr:hypothetical protein [Christensenellaceae bacterium]
MKKTITAAFAFLVLATALLAGGGSVALAASASGAESTAPKTGHGGSHAGTARVNALAVAASVLGIAEDEARAGIKDGKLGDLLLAAGKLGEFKAAYIEAAGAKLDAALAAGALTQAQADEKLAEVKAKMDAYDGTAHLCGGSGRHRAGRGGKEA